MRVTTRRPPTSTPARAIGRGLVAGLVGTALMTAYQALSAVRGGSSLREAVAPPPAASWEAAPAPAQVGHLLLHGVFRRRIPPERSTELANAVHWLYGTAWGGAYGLVATSVRPSWPLGGAALGTAVLASEYAAFPALGIHGPPWRSDGRTLAGALCAQAVYSLGVAGAQRLLERR